MRDFFLKAPNAGRTGAIIHPPAFFVDMKEDPAQKNTKDFGIMLNTINNIGLFVAPIIMLTALVVSVVVVIAPRAL